jgi:hypothetical protein
MDLDPAFHFDTDPDLTFHFDTDLDPTIWYWSRSLMFQRVNVHNLIFLVSNGRFLSGGIILGSPLSCPDLFLYTITLPAVSRDAPATLSYTTLEMASRVLLSSKKPALSLSGPNQQTYLVKFSLTVNFVVLIRTGYWSGPRTLGNRSGSRKIIQIWICNTSVGLLICWLTQRLSGWKCKGSWGYGPKGLARSCTRRGEGSEWEGA